MRLQANTFQGTEVHEAFYHAMSMYFSSMYLKCKAKYQTHGGKLVLVQFVSVKIFNATITSLMETILMFKMKQVPPLSASQGPSSVRALLAGHGPSTKRKVAMAKGIF